MKPLSGSGYTIEQQHLGGVYAASLLRELGAEVQAPVLPDIQYPWQAACDWANSGLMFLTGWPDEPPRQGPAAVPSCANGALLALQLLAGKTLPQHLCGGRLLSERAAILGLQRGGQISANRSCRLLPAVDGWLAVNLARDDDWALLPAWLQADGAVREWPELVDLVRQRTSPVLLERARWLGLPVAALRPAPTEAPPWYRVHWRTDALPVITPQALLQRPPLVVDLSSLWAGPLCTHLLLLLGGRVLKVESVGRPDGARTASGEFYDLLNSGKASVAFDLASAEGREQLTRLLLRADIVVEGSRPRALRQMGIEAQRILHHNPGLTWLSITGYGRREPEADWVAFGDDAAVAAGVAAGTGSPPVFCGDALADPLTGIHAACAALAHWRSGGGVLLDVSLCDVSAHCLGFAPGLEPATVVQQGQHWCLADGGARWPIVPPQPRVASGRAAALGADTAAVCEEFGLLC